MNKLLGLMGGKPNPLLFLAPLNGSLAYQDRAGGGSLTGSGAVRYRAAEGALINLIRNPSAAVSAGNTWIGTTGGSASRTTDTVLGSTAHRIAATSSANSGAIFWGSVAVPGVAKIRAKVAHTFAADVALVSGTANWQLMFYELDGAGNVIGAALGGVSITPTAGGIRVLATYTPTQNGVHSICPGFRHLDASVSELDVRAATLVEGTHASLPHFDGSTGGVWLDPVTGFLGTAHASPSVSQAVLWGDQTATNLFKDPLTNNVPIGSNLRGLGGTVLDTDYGRSAAYAYGPSAYSWWRSGDGVNANRGLSLSTTGPNGVSGAHDFFGAMMVRVSGGPATLRSSIQVKYTDTSWSTAVYTTHSNVGDEWVELRPGKFAMNPAKTIDYATVTIEFTTAVASNVRFYVTCVSLQLDVDVTSVIAGSLGSGYAWTGVAHASTSTRTRLDYSGIVSGLRTSKGHVALRIKDLGGHTVPVFVDGGGYEAGEFGWSLYTFTDGTTDDWFDLGYDNSDYAAVSSGAVTRDTWLFKEGWWSFPQDRLGMSINGTDETDDSTYPFNWADPGVACAGAISGGAGAGQFLLGPVLIADRPLTARERANLNARTSWAWGRL